MGVRIGVMTSCLSDGIDSKRQKCTTLPATQVSLRPVKSGLRGHEAGVSGVDEGIENTSTFTVKTGTNGDAKMSDLQWFFGSWE